MGKGNSRKRQDRGKAAARRAEQERRRAKAARQRQSAERYDQLSDPSADPARIAGILAAELPERAVHAGHLTREVPCGWVIAVTAVDNPPAGPAPARLFLHVNLTPLDLAGRVPGREAREYGLNLCLNGIRTQETVSHPRSASNDIAFLSQKYNCREPVPKGSCVWVGEAS